MYDMLPRLGVARERLLHLEVGRRGELSTLDNALSGFAAPAPSRTRDMKINRAHLG